MRFSRLPRTFAVIAFSLFCWLSQSSLADTATAIKQAVPDIEKVVIQVSDNDPAKWNLVLNNARNIQQDLGENKVDIEIVAFGPGIGMLKFESPVAGRIDDALRAGIRIVACQNTMKAQKLSREDMLGNIGYVPAGVVELIRKQREGYAYLRP